MQEYWVEFQYWLWHHSAFSRAYYWLAHRFIPKHRYNIVRTGLEPGYYDHDTRMESCIIAEFLRWYDPKHINLQIEDCVKQVKLGGSRERYDEYIKIQEIYKEVKKRGLANNVMVKAAYWKNTDILIDIVKLRKHFWS